MKIISTGNPNSAYPLEGRMMTFQNGLTTTVSGEMVLLTVSASQFRSENPKEY